MNVAFLTYLKPFLYNFQYNRIMAVFVICITGRKSYNNETTLHLWGENALTEGGKGMENISLQKEKPSNVRYFEKFVISSQPEIIFQ